MAVEFRQHREQSSIILDRGDEVDVISSGQGAEKEESVGEEVGEEEEEEEEYEAEYAGATGLMVSTLLLLHMRRTFSPPNGAITSMGLFLVADCSSRGDYSEFPGGSCFATT